ncbi:MAG: PKD domain-containing protein [Saprospiraceae bacterium]|nr:PKD domain-containing protein [Saprospiraceae bacterium]
MDDLERKMNFRSLRQSPVFLRDEEEEGFTQEEIMAAMENDFINDDLIKSLLNIHYELGIEEDIYVFFSQNQVYKIIDGDQETVDAFRSLAKGTDEVPFPAFNSTVEMEPNDVFYLLKNSPSPNDTLEWRACPVDFRGFVDRGDLGCNSFSIMVRGNLFCTTFGNSPSPCNSIQYRIDFGDGNFIITGFNQHQIDVPHTYTQPGVYTVTVRVTAPDGDCDEDEEPEVANFPFTFTVGMGDCDNRERDTSGWENGSFRAISSKVWCNNNLFGSYAGAYTHSWRWNNSRARWVRWDSNISATINATFRGDFCALREQKQETDSCNSCRQKRAVVSLGNNPAYGNREVFSTHTFRLDPPQWNPNDIGYFMEIVTCQ